MVFIELSDLESHLVSEPDCAASVHDQVDVNEGAGDVRQGEVGHHLVMKYFRLYVVFLVGHHLLMVVFPVVDLVSP